VDLLNGKTVRRREPHVIMSDILPIPHDILSLYREVTLCIDMIMYVNKIALLVTISRHIKFAMIELLANWQAETIGKSVTDVMRLYGSRGFLVNMTRHADGEFELLRGQLAGAGSALNSCSNDEHVPEIEHFIRTLKGRAGPLYVQLSPFSPFSRPHHDQRDGHGMCVLVEHVSFP
jgi:hypothetical protein